ncbi:hypothetical protein MTR_8g040600 [Medicago truncatula]|uniref:Uncharacterized protein n=1 Tax=Medicago truncatula TaxID=3880 RepID=G7LHL4_MEDTR|nr:hypothetical protein MTR_8g040600 [Medicago truncatula]
MNRGRRNLVMLQRTFLKPLKNQILTLKTTIPFASDAEYVEDLDEIQSDMFAGPCQSDEDTLCFDVESLDVY